MSEHSIFPRMEFERLTKFKDLELELRVADNIYVNVPLGIRYYQVEITKEQAKKLVIEIENSIKYSKYTKGREGMYDFDTVAKKLGYKEFGFTLRIAPGTPLNLFISGTEAHNPVEDIPSEESEHETAE